jgi:hypothetical protein
MQPCHDDEAAAHANELAVFVPRAESMTGVFHRAHFGWTRWPLPLASVTQATSMPAR